MTGRLLILSVFPGIDLLGRAFEEVWPEACLVRGPDLLWGGDIRQFHPPPGVFDGIIGGPPCQLFSQLKYLVPKAGEKHGNMIPEFERVVTEAQPEWFLMENVPRAPVPMVTGYVVKDVILNNRWLGEVQERIRRFSFGTTDGRPIFPETVALEHIDYRQAVTSSLRAVPVKLRPDGRPKRTYTADGKRHGPGQGHRAKFPEMLRLQGLPDDFLSESPLTMTGKRQALGNGVPLAMGRAVARAVRKAVGA